MGLIEQLRSKVAGWVAPPASATTLPNETRPGETEVGRRTTPESALKYMYSVFWVDPAVRQAILDIREMDRLDGRVKRIHARVARDAVKGGLVFTQPKNSPRLRKLWDDYARRCQLDNPVKLKSDARGLVMEGNLPMQWVLDGAGRVCAGVRMPTDTLVPNVDASGRFKDVRRAYVQMDIVTGVELAAFPLWQLTLARYDPDSYDDLGALGRPFLDASRTVWRKLRMTEEDLVIRRRTRAPLRMAHVLEGASDADIETYRQRVENDQGEITTDFYLNKKGSVTAVQGDAALDQIGDVTYLLDTFFSGSPLPKGMMGYTDGMARDILEDLKRDYYDEVDLLQDTQAHAYNEGFRLDLMLRGIVPDPEEYLVSFAERRTETKTQTTDRALKWQAMGMPHGLIWEELGFNAQAIQERLDDEAKRGDPYPAPDQVAAPGRMAGVKVTPGNAPKGESATSIQNPPRRLSDHWPDSADN